MKACRHYRRFGCETHIIASDGYPWNAWVLVYENNQLIHSSFEAGLRAQYFEHLVESEECRKEVGVSKARLRRILKQIEKEYQAVTRDC